MDISRDDLLQLLGLKEVEIFALRKRVAELEEAANGSAIQPN